MIVEIHILNLPILSTRLAVCRGWGDKGIKIPGHHKHPHPGTQTREEMGKGGWGPTRKDGRGVMREGFGRGGSRN